MTHLVASAPIAGNPKTNKTAKLISFLHSSRIPAPFTTYKSGNDSRKILLTWLNAIFLGQKKIAFIMDFQQDRKAPGNTDAVPRCEPAELPLQRFGFGAARSPARRAVLQLASSYVGTPST